MKIPAPDEFAEKGGYNPFPPRWEKWLSAVRQSILSAQPVAGRNVSVDEHPGKGTVINVERRPGAAEEPPGECECDDTWDCPGGCTPPEGDCIHYVSFQVRLTQCDIDNDFSNLFDLGVPGHAGGHNLNIFCDSSGFFRATGGLFGDHARVDIQLDPLVACACYDLLLAFNDPGEGDPEDPNPITMFFCVNGVSDSVDVARSAAFLCDDLTQLDVGNVYGGDVLTNRTYRRFIASPGFDMSTDTFDSLENASVITQGGENVLLIDAGADPGYGREAISWIINCSCP